MKTLLITFLFIPVLIYSQYNEERATEQSFEQSDLYYKSSFLNTFGIGSFKNTAVGSVNDPFLNLYLNPAYTPVIKNDIIAYLDFRSDRRTPVIVENFAVPYYYDYMSRSYPYVDPRWLSTTRSEPEPVFSLGLIAYPFKELTDKLVIAGTYQLIHKNENYYSVPYEIYNSRFMYDSFNSKVAESGSIPIVDRFSGKDEMMNEGHLFSAFLSYKLFDNLSLGLGLNGVSHSRNGRYLNSNKDDYKNIDNMFSENSNMQSRNQDYNHLDLNAGIMYNLTPKLSIGLKAGVLNGKVDQDYESGNYSQYTNNTPYVSNDWYAYYSNSGTIQNWKHDGKTSYLSFNFDRNSGNDKKIRGYYRYGVTKVNLTNSSVIHDTSFYSSRYHYNNFPYDGYSTSSLSDVRTGSGNREKTDHEGILSFFWNLTKNFNFTIDFYFNSYKETIFSAEPVTAYRMSQYNYTYPEAAYTGSNTLTETKRLDWEYSMKYWTIQIPVIIEFKITDYIGMAFGINRTLTDWEINDRTTAYFTLRENVENGVPRVEQNFGERYTQPTTKKTENNTDFISRFDISVSDKLNIHLWLDPNFEGVVSISQWWLSFQTEL
jgi:hypothetical protein